jgi:hypothetical protein
MIDSLRGDHYGSTKYIGSGSTTTDLCSGLGETSKDGAIVARTGQGVD